jgi:hypothetical protein
MYDASMNIEHFDSLVIVGLLLYIVFAAHDLKKEVVAIRKKLEGK